MIFLVKIVKEVKKLLILISFGRRLCFSLSTEKKKKSYCRLKVKSSGENRATQDVTELKEYCYTIVFRAQYVAGGHFVSDISIKYFYNPSKNKAILYESLIIFIDFYY